MSASQLLDVWEHGYGQTAAQRALILLKAASPDESPEALAQLTIGRRDARLLRLRELIFGSTLSSIIVCPTCGETLEFAVDVQDVLVLGNPLEDVDLSIEGFDMTIRLPTVGDLIAVANASAQGRRLLVEHCMSRLEHKGQPADVADLPEEIIVAIGEKLADADPQADIELAVECPACGFTWDAPLDIVMFFWMEIDAWARRTIQDVHILASAYGWRETDILAMSAWRRQLYLQLVSV